MNDSGRATRAQLRAVAQAVLDEHHRGEHAGVCVRCLVPWPCRAADLADLTLTTTSTD